MTNTSPYELSPGSLLQALGDPTRRAVFERLGEGPQAVGEIAAALPVSRPAVSQHLRVLKDAGLVTDRPQGARRIYEIDADGVAALRKYLDSFWTTSLGRFKAVAEKGNDDMSMQAATDTTVTSRVRVEAPIERAFHVFTAEIGTWWDPTHHILEAELAEMVFEPRAGGHIYDRGVDGSECRWARVLAFDPPRRVVFSWDIDARWQLESDPAKTSEVEVTFAPAGPGATIVELTHRHLERHGEGWEGIRDAVGSPGGWPAGMESFARVAGAGA
jgi:DNA-binding transcriptional ArsR family regulator/uncharacterized protein YndB with AHSA1/START domain